MLTESPQVTDETREASPIQPSSPATSANKPSAVAFAEKKIVLSPRMEHAETVEAVMPAHKAAVALPNSGGKPLKPYLSQQPISSKPMVQTSEPTVTIHIGRIEVYVVKEPEMPVSPPRSPVLSLAEYLKQRSKGQLMSDFRAIATVTAVLRDILQDVQLDAGAMQVKSLPLDALSKLTDDTLNVYLYQVTPNAAWRNMDLPARTSDGKTLIAKPQLAIDLHYLLTAFTPQNDELKARADAGKRHDTSARQRNNFPRQNRNHHPKP